MFLAVWGIAWRGRFGEAALFEALARLFPGLPLLREAARTRRSVGAVIRCASHDAMITITSTNTAFRR